MKLGGFFQRREKKIRKIWNPTTFKADQCRVFITSGCSCSVFLLVQVMSHDALWCFCPKPGNGWNIRLLPTAYGSFLLPYEKTLTVVTKRGWLVRRYSDQPPQQNKSFWRCIWWFSGLKSQQPEQPKKNTFNLPNQKYSSANRKHLAQCFIVRLFFFVNE